MKRLLAIAFALVLVSALCIIPASAAESYDLIPAEGTVWNKTDNGGASVTVDYQDDATVFSGSVSGTWPCVDFYYEADDRITANIDEYSIVYDFTVQGGAANINFYFTDGFGTSGGYTIANNALGNVSYDAGSGDLYDGDIKGVIRLSDFVNSTKFLNGETFPTNMITADNEIIFSGIQFYSVNGGTITVRQLAIVPNEEAGDPTGGETGDESSEAPAESSDAIDESSDAIDESSEATAESSEATAESSEATAESSEVIAESTADTSDNASGEDEGGLGIWLYVIIGAAVVVVVVVVVILINKKKQ